MWPFRAKSDDAPSFNVGNTIGAGTSVHGDLKGPGGFRIDGAIEGSIETDGPVVIGEGGSIIGGVTAREVVVLGSVRGDVEASGHLEIGPKGKIIGDLTVQSFRMQTGGVFRGTSRMPGGGDSDESDEDDENVLESGPKPVGALPAPTRDARGRTLPPPGQAAVPPPASAGSLAAAASHERLVTLEADDLEERDEAANG